ncbi:MAG: hypothetical protein JWL97_3496 [Gemmatimonadales bacterium]|nr:hypothetical protein [Gemmatimonadales bacterium]
MSEPQVQVIPARMWTRALGLEAHVLHSGGGSIPIAVEDTDHDGRPCVQLTFEGKDGPVTLRVPKHGDTQQADDLAVLAAVGRMYLTALDADPDHEYLTLPEVLQVTSIREAVERQEARYE